jgi:non-ribosomal peptide synthetase component E (peptide arylation enzyme)
MVPHEAYPPGLGNYRVARDAEGFVRTGFRCRSDGNGALIVEAGPHRVVSIGGLRFGLDDLQTRFSAIDESVKVLAIEDPLLGERLRIETADRESAVAALLAAGHSQLVIDAIKEERSHRAAG